MKAIWNTLWLMSVVVLTACSVMPTTVEQAALPPMDFQVLIRQAQDYTGQTVVLGGYVVSVENRTDHSRIVALEAPLGFRREPGSKDLSRGRLVLLYEGFVDPVVYAEGRKISIAGVLLGSSATDPDPEPYPYLRVAVDTLYLWPEAPPVRHEPFYRDPWGYPYPYPWWGRYPYWW
ncbi:MAG: Slp family lipoprotein [Desulfatitalea sp.]|nr:Slp family lipoprotein [Desulfatitalea sp.]